MHSCQINLTKFGLNCLRVSDETFFLQAEVHYLVDELSDDFNRLQ